MLSIPTYCMHVAMLVYQLLFIKWNLYILKGNQQLPLQISITVHFTNKHFMHYYSNGLCSRFHAPTLLQQLQFTFVSLKNLIIYHNCKLLVNKKSRTNSIFIIVGTHSKFSLFGNGFILNLLLVLRLAINLIFTGFVVY